MAKSSWCGRSSFYRITGLPEDYKAKPPSFRLSNVFDYGHSVHSKYQRWLFEMGVLWGKWRCVNCGDSWVGGTPSNMEWCVHCELNTVVYAEVPLEHPELMISGHCDGIVRDGDTYRMIEIKTVGIPTLRFENFKLFERYQSEQLTPDELWFNINRPFSTHIRQGQLYLHIAKTAFPYLEIDEIVFIYEWKATQEVKEFVVRYNQDFIAGVLRDASSVVGSVGTGVAPDRPSWAAVGSKTCGSCEYRKTCWGGGSLRGAGEKGDTNESRIMVRRSSRKPPVRRRA
jgi:hypothetical protein